MVSCLSAVLIVLLLALFALAILILNNQRQLTNDEEIRYDSYLAADELRQSSDDLTRLARTYVSTVDSKYEDQYWEILDIRNGKKPRPDGRSIPLRKIMEKLGFTEKEFDKLKEAEDNSNSLVTTETIAMHAVKGLFDDGVGGYTKQGEPDLELARRIMFDQKYHEDKAIIMDPISDFVDMLEARTKRDVVGHEKDSFKYLFMAVALIVLLTLVFFVLFLLLKRITRSILKVVHLIDVVSTGDFTINQKIKSNDEVGHLNREINKMVESLNKDIVEVSSVARDLNLASQEVSTLSQRISDGANQQAASFEELSSSVQSNSETAQSANTLAQNIDENAKKAEVSMRNTIESMGTIEKSSQEITQAVNLITDIAEQTNLLALNAAIEAARAGEHGRGFAVVADEVRKLAVRSGASAKDIEDLLKDSLAQVQKGVDVSQKAGENLQKIVDDISEITDQVSRISLSTQEQAASMEENSSITESNASGADSLATTAAQSSSQSEKLQKLVGKFKLK